MSSSSSDSDSDDLGPIRRIKINIKPKDAVAKREGADIDAIKASVEAWRPLGPRPHHSLTRRQSSLSSVSSLSFGAGHASGSASGGSHTTTATTSSSASANTNPYLYQYHSSSGSTATAQRANNTANNHCMRSSPSCSSLVNEFNNRSSFSNFMPNASRTSSPLTFMQGAPAAANSNLGDTVPIALAIQESIELTVKGQQNGLQEPSSATLCGTGETKTKFETRALGNIKVAFPNTFARLCSSGAKPIAPLKLRLHATEHIIRYYASGLIKDLDSESSSLAESVDSAFNNENNNNNNNNNNNSDSTSNSNGQQRRDFSFDLFDMNESPTKIKSNTKVIEFDMEALTRQLKQLYDQTPNSRYYNLDVLRYQIAPVDRFEKCPLQVCAYWKLEPKLIKLRVDFKHSNQSGLTLERLREISFSADLSNLVPTNVKIIGVSPNQLSSLIKPSNISSTSNSFNNDNNLDSVYRSMTDNLGPRSLFGDHNNKQAQPIITTGPRPTQQSSNSISNLIDVSNGTQEALDRKLIAQIAPPLPPPNAHHAIDQQQPQPAPRQLNSNHSSNMLIKLPPPPSRHHHHHSRSNNLSQMSGVDTSRGQPSPLTRNTSSNSSGRSDVLSLYEQPIKFNHDKSQTQQQASQIPLLSTNLQQQAPMDSTISNLMATQQVQTTSTAPTLTTDPNLTTGATQPILPYITYEPQASWCDQTRQLIWKFDNLLSFYKNDGYGSLLAKLDFRHCVDGLPTTSAGLLDDASDRESKTPKSLDIKFMVVDSTLSKISLSIDSTGYRMTLLKKEVRSGRYKSEPCTF